MIIQYDDESRIARAYERAVYLDELLDLKGKRILEVGCGHGDLLRILAEEYGCDVVGIDVMRHGYWRTITHDKVRFVEGDISQILLEPPFQENSFDRIVSYCAWEHIRHPFSALAICQKLLHPKGKKYLHVYLGGYAKLSHLYDVIPEPWAHLTRSVRELEEALGRKELPWYCWCNRLTHAHYLTYFRQLGFYITYEHIIEDKYDDYYKENEQFLGLFPLSDLKNSALLAVLEFDETSPKQPIADPVYTKCTHNSRK